jgi:hypothetical protein
MDMISTMLFCILWAKPNLQLVEVPVNQYAMADIKKAFGDFYFEASVLEDKLNYVKITHLPTTFSSEANASQDYKQRSFYIKLDMNRDQASLDCELRVAAPKD